MAAQKAPRPPTPARIREARETAQLTQEEAAALIYSARRSWENWEGGVREMHPAMLELFLIKTGQPTGRK